MPELGHRSGLGWEVLPREFLDNAFCNDATGSRVACPPNVSCGSPPNFVAMLLRRPVNVLALVCHV